MAFVSERTTLYFQYEGVFYPATKDAAVGFISGIMASAAKATAMFEHIIITRSYINQVRLESMNHGQQGAYIRGPLNSEKFLQIVNCKSGLSPDAWAAFMNTFKNPAIEKPEGPPQDAETAVNT